MRRRSPEPPLRSRRWRCRKIRTSSRAGLAGEIDALALALERGGRGHHRDAAARRRGARDRAGPDARAVKDPSAALAAIEALAKLLADGDADAEVKSNGSPGCLPVPGAGERASAVAASAGRFDFEGPQTALNELRAELVEGS